MTYETPIFVYPITDHRTSKEKIFEYLQAFPMSTTVDIGAALDMSVQYVGMILVRLHNAGMVVREKVPGQRRIMWDAVGENDDRLCKPSRETVSTWKPIVTRCELVAALFGPAPAQVGA
jgi:hypothetical protein